MRFAALAAPHFESVEIVELHHAGKVDAPSGTARRDGSGRSPQHDGRRLRPGARRDDAEPGRRPRRRRRRRPVHSVRLRGLVAHQEVLLGRRGRDPHDPPRLARPRVVHARRAARRAQGRRPARPHRRPRAPPRPRLTHGASLFQYGIGSNAAFIGTSACARGSGQGAESGGDTGGDQHDDDERRLEHQADEGRTQPGEPRVGCRLSPEATTCTAVRPASRVIGNRIATACTRSADSHRSGTDRPASLST